MGDYRPQQRQVKCSVYTDLGWLSATFHCSLKQPLVEYLNHPASFFRLTDAILPGAEHALPFLALHKSSVRMLAPKGKERLVERDSAKDPVYYPVSCFLHDGLLSGTLRGNAGHRLSDFLINHSGFFVLRDCIMRGRGEATDSLVKRVPVMVVNDSAVIGISEERQR